MQVLVFHTTAKNQADVKRLGSQFNCNPFIHRWNVDLSDCVDSNEFSVLRIETEALTAQAIVQLVYQVGFICEELTD